MSELAILPQTGVIRHYPELMRQEQAKGDAIIEYAKKVKDWPLLEQAIALKIEQQAEFVEAWDERIQPNHRPETNSDRNYLSRRALENLTDILQPQVSRWRKRLLDKRRYAERMIQAAKRAAELRAAANHRAEGTGENEWFTPVDYIDAARLVLEGIELDPATHPIAQETIKAENFFTRQDDGLKHPWHGRVWLNPPYARGEIAPFVTKLVNEIEAGRVSTAIMLTHSYTDTEWFHRAVSVMQALCFTNGRIKFIDDAGDTCSPTQGQVFFYYGPDIEEFESVFNVFGFIATPWRQI